MEAKTILAFQTSQFFFQGCLYQNGSVVKEVSRKTIYGLDQYLLDDLESLIIDGGWQSIDRIVLTVGPGSFTGLRMGIACARILGYLLKCPVLGVPSFVLGYHMWGPQEGLWGIALESGRKDAYISLWDGSTPVTGPTMMTVEEYEAWRNNRPIILYGDTKIPFHGLRHSLLDTAFLAQWGQAENPESYPCEPFYVRPPDISYPTPAK
jgi:tRNA threonylcarbamoyladenosine biosynthesis protein TsaB